MKTIGAYLLDQLYENGVREIYGIPGDFVLAFFQCIEKHKKLKLITLSHEPGLGFAADATARITGRIAACAVTYGAGGHNVVNPIACAWAEKSPVVVISGAPGVSERKTGILFHHQAKTLDSQLKIFSEVTQTQVVLDDPKTAAQKIHDALQTAKLYARPVYIELPRDRVFESIRLPRHLETHPLKNDPDATQEAAREIHSLFSKSRHPVLMIGIEVHRFNLQKEAVKLAEHWRIPVVSSFMARATFPVHHPQFAGIYIGPAGPKKVQQAVEKSDCLILLGVPLADTDMAVRLQQLKPGRVVHCVSREVVIGHHRYENASLQGLLEALLRLKVKPHSKKLTPFSPNFPLPPRSYFDDTPLQVEDIVYAANRLFHEKGPMVTTVDNGDCLFASTLLDADQLLASGYYATMGFAVPAGIGVQIATGKRPLILVGDGAFQMTGMEISHCPRLKLNPIVIVFNNARWEMLRVLQPVGSYFNLTPWPFAELARLWGGKGYNVHSRRQMANALFEAYRQKTFTLIDAHIPLGQTSAVLRNYLAKIRE
ncbi:MAG: thiamine pyrophosphate-binding protein [bacterium]